MGLDTLTFSFLFLPAVMLCFYACPPKYQNAVLATASLLFYAINEWKSLPLMLASLLMDYLVCARMVRSAGGHRGRQVVFWLSVVKNMGLLVGAMALQQLDRGTMPLGLMIYTMTSMGYVIDVYNGDEPFDGNLVDYLLFASFWGKLYAGPIVQYSEMKKEWQERNLSFSHLEKGVRRYVGGLARLVILARGSVAIQTAVQQIPQGEETVLSVWLLIISSTFALYYTLTGYCSMARGLAAFFGMELPENFHYPFQSRTVSDFFNRFNITVTRFITRYVYIFLGADTNGVLPTILNTLLTTMLMGLWFGLRLNCLVWGIYFTVFILLEKYFLMPYLQKMPPILDRIYTFVVVMFSFSILSGSSLRTTGSYLSGMFGLGGLPFANHRIAYILSSNYLVILLCFFFATSLTRLLGESVRKRMPRPAEILSFAVCLLVFGVSVAFMI